MVRAYLCGFALLVTATSLLADELRTLGGKTIAGTLSAISGSEVTLTNDAGTVATPLAQVLAVELRPSKRYRRPSNTPMCACLTIALSIARLWPGRAMTSN